MIYIVLKMVKRLLWDVSKQSQFLRIIWYYFKAILKDNILSCSVFQTAFACSKSTMKTPKLWVNNDQS